MIEIPVGSTGYKKVVCYNKITYKRGLEHRLEFGGRLGLGFRFVFGFGFGDGVGYSIVELKLNTPGICPLNNKCRTESVNVIGIENYNPEKVYFSNYDIRVVYVPGKVVFVNNFDATVEEECAPGIHFFRTIEEARNYNL